MTQVYLLTRLRILSLLFLVLSSSQCLFDHGTTAIVDGFPYLLAGTGYECIVQGLIRNWSSSSSGFSGVCQELSTANFLSFIAQVSDSAPSGFQNVQMYQDYTSSLVCDSDETTDSNIICLADNNGDISLLAVDKTFFTIQGVLVIYNYSYTLNKISAYHIKVKDDRIIFALSSAWEYARVIEVDQNSFETYSSASRVMISWLNLITQGSSAGIFQIEPHDDLGIIASGISRTTTSIRRGFILDINARGSGTVKHTFEV